MWISVLLGFISLTAFFLAMLTFASNARIALRLSFAFFASSMGIWAAGVGLFLVTPDPIIASIAVNVYYVAALFLVFGLMIFAYVFSDKQATTRSSRRVSIMTALLSLPVIALSILILTPHMFITTVTTAPLADVQLVLSGYSLYTVVFIAYGAAALLLLSRKHLTDKRHDSRRIQQRIISLLLYISLPAASLFNLILPLFGNYSLIAIGPLFVLPVVITFFYTIMRHSLFDIRLAIVRTVAYILSLFTLAILYIVIAYILSSLIFGKATSTLDSLLGVGLALALAFIFQPIKQFFDRVTNTFFYRDNYNSDDFFARLSRTLTSTTDLRGLLEQAANEIGHTLKAEQAFFFIDTPDGHYISTGTRDHKQLPKSDALALDNARGEGHEIILASLLSLHNPIRRLMISHRIELILPLFQGAQYIGYLCLGDPLASSYTSRDLRVLRTIADELVIAIENALSVQEVKALNANLQQRIDTATRELRASNAQLQKLDESKDEFISMASHQLRTPLTSIKGYISMLMDGDAGKVTNDQKHLLEEAFISSERMVRLIGDFLNVSRLQTGKFMVDKHPLSLAKIVTQEIEGLGPNANARGLQFIYNEPKNIPLMQLDENKIQQVIMNFSDNAIYYSKENSTIKIKLEIVGDNVEFTVKDTGIGVPNDEQDQLFNKFFRATNARKQRPDGTGVGLFLAKKVIDAHDGQIIFHSTEGKGSTFGFRLPLPKIKS